MPECVILYRLKRGLSVGIVTEPDSDEIAVWVNYDSAQKHCEKFFDLLSEGIGHQIDYQIVELDEL